MASFCPAPEPDAPLVRSLLGVVDCNTQQMVHAGYVALFRGSGGFSDILTVILTLYIAFIGYGLMLGRSQLRVTDFALTALKIGVVLALATQWDTYQALVYRFLFDGPRQLAAVMVSSIQPDQSAFRGDVFDGLQRAFDDLSGAANAYSAHSPGLASPLLGGTGFGAIMLTMGASILLLSSLGVLLAAKIVLGLLLAVGPLFIALALFDSTRGLFEGWLRASFAFAFAPLATTLLLCVALNMLEPSLLQIEELRKHGVFVLGPIYSVMTLILVFAGVSFGAILAGGMIATGLRLPSRNSLAPSIEPVTPTHQTISNTTDQSRATRIAAAAAAMERREITIPGSFMTASISDRRTEIIGGLRASETFSGRDQPRLGQATRRTVRPRTPRPTARTV